MKPKILLFLITPLLIAACSSGRRLFRPCPENAVTQDSLWLYEKLIIRDTIVLIQIPEAVKADTVNIAADSVYSSQLQTGWCLSIAKWENGRLLHYLQQKDTLLKHTVKEGIQQKIVYRYRNIVKTKKLEVNSLSRWQELQIQLFWIVLAALLALILIRKSSISPIGSVFSLMTKWFIRPNKPP